MLGRRYGDVLPLESGPVELVVQRDNKQAVALRLKWRDRDSRQVRHPYHDVWDSAIRTPDGAVRLKAPSTAYVATTMNEVRIGFLRIPNFLVSPQEYEKSVAAY